MQKRQIDRSDSPSCSVLVLSCDRYRDLWRPFFTLFDRYWPDCELPLFLGSNGERIDREDVETLPAEVDEAWGKRLRCFLEDIESDYVLLMLEDFFLDRRVENEQVDEYLQLLDKLGGVSLRLYPNPPADYWRDGLGVLHARAPFRVSLQATIWNRRQLLELLVDDESPWDFEIHGSRRSRAVPSGFYCVPQAVIHYRHVVERGEWFHDAARRYRADDIGCDFAARPVMTVSKTWKKKQLNRVRRYWNRVHSKWLCLFSPERL